MLKHKKTYPWIVVALLWFVALLNYMDRQMLSTMKDAMMIDIQELQMAENFGVLMAVFLYIYGFMSPIAGSIADRINRKWLIVGSLFVWSSVTYGMGLATDFHQLLILRAVMGVSEALYIPAALSMITDYHTDKTRSLAVGIHMTGLYTGQALGGFGATVAATFTWHTTFHWFGIIGMVYALILILLLDDKKRTTNTQTDMPREKIPIFRGIGMIFTNIAFWVILFYFAAPSLPGWATKNWLPTLFSQSLDIPMSQAGPLSTITISVASFVGILIGGPLSDKWVQKTLKGRIYTSAIGIGLMIPSLILLGFSHSLLPILISGLLFGIGYGMFDTNNMPILCQFVPSKLRATAYGIMNMVGVFFGAAITQILGKVSDSGNLGGGFAILGLIVFMALILQLTLLKPSVQNME